MHATFNMYRIATNRLNKYDEMTFSNYIQGFGGDECDVKDKEKELDILCGKHESYGLIRRRIHNLVRITKL